MKRLQIELPPLGLVRPHTERTSRYRGPRRGVWVDDDEPSHAELSRIEREDEPFFATDEIVSPLFCNDETVRRARAGE